jgi:hypothetical protein
MLHPLLAVVQSHEILLNQGMKYSVSGLNAPRSKTDVSTVHIAAVIGSKRSEKERTGQTQFSIQFVRKLSFTARERPVCFFYFPSF